MNGDGYERRTVLVRSALDRTTLSKDPLHDKHQSLRRVVVVRRHGIPLLITTVAHRFNGRLRIPGCECAAIVENRRARERWRRTSRRFLHECHELLAVGTNAYFSLTSKTLISSVSCTAPTLCVAVGLAQNQDSQSNPTDVTILSAA
jgi:hypothetical protein